MHSLFLSLLMQTHQTPYAVDPHYMFEVQRRVWEQQRHQQKINPNSETKRQAAVEEYFFVERFNKLLESLRDFTESYNSGQVDVKKAKAVQKAWQNLEKTEGWFKREKEKKEAAKAAPQIEATAVKVSAPASCDQP